MHWNVFQSAGQRLGVLCVLLVLAVLSLARTSHAASERGRMVVFGDSLVDTGNTSVASHGAVPGPAYYDGRFSNGPVWVEYLADDLNVPRPRPVLEGGTNYAFGGSQTEDGPGPDPRIDFIDLNEQVDTYLARQAARPRRRSPVHTLHVVQSGANDFLIGGQTDPTVPAANVAMSIERLHEQGGAKNVLVANMPNLGSVPAVNDDPEAAAGLQGLSVAYNQALDAQLNHIEDEHPDLHLFQLDLGSGLDQILAAPGEFGLTNVTDPAAKDLDLLSGDTVPSQIVANPDQYLFWDSIHASGAGHQILGEFATRAVGDLDLNAQAVPTPMAAGLLSVCAGLMLVTRPYRKTGRTHR